MVSRVLAFKVSYGHEVSEGGLPHEDLEQARSSGLTVIPLGALALACTRPVGSELRGTCPSAPASAQPGSPRPAGTARRDGLSPGVGGPWVTTLALPQATSNRGGTK